MLKLDTLPTEILLKIFVFLPVPDLVETTRANRRIHRITQADAVYKPKLNQLGISGRDDFGKIIVDPALSLAPMDTLVVLQRRGRQGASLFLDDADDDLGLEVSRNVGSWGRSPSRELKPLTPTIQPERLSVDKGIPRTSQDVRKSQDAPQNVDDLLQFESINLGPAQRVQPALMDFYKSARQINKNEGALEEQDAKYAIKTWMMPTFQEQYKLLKGFLKDFEDPSSVNSDEPLSILKSSPRADEVAEMFRRLQRFAVGGYVYHSDRFLKPIAKAVDRLEANLLQKFEEAYNENDLERMKEYANAGFQLNGGGAMVQVFISKNPLLYDEAYNPSLRASRLIEMSSSDSQNQYALSAEFTKFMETWLVNVKQQADIIAQVFPPETNALSHFVEAIFQASVQDYLTSVLAEAKNRDKVTYLNTFATAVSTCHQFLQYLGSMDEDEVKHDFSSVLELISETFQPYYGSYIQEELVSLEQLYNQELTKFDTDRAKRKKAQGTMLDDDNHKQTVLTTMKNILLAPTYLTKSLISPFRSKEEEPKGYESAVDLTQLHLDDKNLAYLVSLELCLGMIHQNKEALRRDWMIAGALNKTRLRPDAQAIYVVLLKAINRHIHSGFKEAVATLAATKPFDDSDSLVVGSLVQFFELVHIADLIHQMLHVYYMEDVKKYVDENDFRSPVVAEKKLMEATLDDLVAHGMDSAIRVLIDHLEWVLLSEQKATDFDPPANDPLDLTPTPACLKVVACLNAHTKMISGSTDKHIMDVFCQEIGVRFYHSVCKNLRRSRISPTGGLRVICDLNEYYNWASSLRNPEVTRLYTLLKELGNIYIVEKPSDLRDMIHDPSRYHGMIRIEEIYELLQGRTDWKRIQRDVETNECTIQ